MKLLRRAFLHLAAGAAALLVTPSIAAAQLYPTRPITIVVPYPAGGGADVVARIMAEHMRTFLGQSIVVENVGGASGNIGTGRVVRAAPDGYTLGIGNWSTHVGNGALYVLPYDVLRDFEPVALHFIFHLVLVGRNTLPANNLKELIAWLKANPDMASAGTTGVGSSGHLAGILFQNITSTRFQHVPYRGNALALQDLVAGQIDLIFADQSALSQVRAGTIKGFAVAAGSRLPGAPDLPTAEEAGLPGFSFASWNAVFAPKGTPKAIIGKLNDAITSALAQASIGQKLADLGGDVPAREQQTPEALRALLKAEIERWWPIIKAAGIKGE
jgi:tripartite-type tricarboxylate transporter receptor subunit TctC